MPVQPGEKEQEYFARQEFLLRKQKEEERRRQMQEEEKKRLRDLHFMHCPKCGADLIEIDYKSVKLDKCTACEGLWFDAKEFETILEMERPALKKVLSLFKQ